MEDKHHILKEEQPFSYKLLKDDKVQIYYRGKAVKCLSGKDYLKLLRVIREDDPYQIQLVMAKATGNFKRGNERLYKRSH